MTTHDSPSFVAWSAAGMITMKANMALCLGLGGLALLLGYSTTCERRLAISGIIALVVLLVGALTLGEHIFNVNLHIDELLATEAPGAPATVRSRSDIC